MGRGDKRTRKGKISAGSFGNKRQQTGKRKSKLSGQNAPHKAAPASADKKR
jgi:ribosomal small subunit protein bTHX